MATAVWFINRSRKKCWFFFVRWVQSYWYLNYWSLTTNITWLLVTSFKNVPPVRGHVFVRLKFSVVGIVSAGRRYTVFVCDTWTSMSVHVHVHWDIWNIKLLLNYYIYSLPRISLVVWSVNWNVKKHVIQIPCKMALGNPQIGISVKMCLRQLWHFMP